MTGAIDAAADMVDVGGNPADSGSQFFLFSVIDLDDIPIDECLPGIRAEIAGAELVRLVANQTQLMFIQADFPAGGSCAVWHIETLLS